MINYKKLYNELLKSNESNYAMGYQQGESAGITRVLDILERLDTQMLEKVKNLLYEQDFQQATKQKTSDKGAEE